MTTNGAAAARHLRKLTVQAALMLLTGVALTGCGTSSSLLSNNEAAKPEPTVAQAPALAVAPQPAVRKLTLAPVIGAPETVAKPLASELASAMGRHKVGVAANGERSDWTLRGYVVAAAEKTGTKVSYIWDVTDSAGKRVHRITGEETVAGAAGGKDPWAAVSPPLIQKISDKTASSVAAWVPTQGAPTAAPAIAQAPSAAGGPMQTASAAQQAPVAARPVAGAQVAAAPVAATTTGSLAGNAMSVVVPPVSKAPGDGAQSLTAAIQRELQSSGVAVGTGAPGAATYRVEGRVAVGAGKDGKQPIQIDWEVKDPAGKKVGVVSQKNEIAQGSLDGAWGQTADAAAAAAAQGIVKLLQQPKGGTSTN